MASMQIKTSVTEEKAAEAARVRRRPIKIEEALLAGKIAKPLDVSAQARSSAIPQWDTTADFTSALSFVVADASLGASQVVSLFFDVFTFHKKKIDRKVSNFFAEMAKSAGMTRLQLAENEPSKLDAATFPRWCADGPCSEIAHQPFLFAISPVTLVWDASFYPCPGLGASSVALRGSLFVCALAAHGHVMGWGNKHFASLLAFLNQTEFPKNCANDAEDISLKPDEAIWFFYGHLPLITALACEGEQSVQMAAVFLLLPTYSKIGY